MPKENVETKSSPAPSGTDLSLAEFEKLCRICRANGVVNLTYRGATVNLLPEMPAEEKEPDIGDEVRSRKSRKRTVDDADEWS